MFEYVMGMQRGTPPPATPDSELPQRLLAGAGNCPSDVVAIVDALTAAVESPVSGELGTAVGLADRLTVLARIRSVLDAEIGRTAVAAQTHDVLAHSPATHLQRTAAWSGPDASGVVVAGRLAARHRSLEQLWRTGRVSTDVVAVIARGLRGVSHDVEGRFLTAVADQLPSLSLRAVKVLISRTLDLLFPDDAQRQEQLDWDRRALTSSRHSGMTMIQADLPGLEGDAVMAALDALADSLRVAGDPTTTAQRRADALITLVNRAAAHGDLPATRSGLPVATTITIGVSEADRVATGQPRTPSPDLTSDLTGGRDPRAVALTTSSGAPVTLGDAAVRFALCAASHTGVVIDDLNSGPTPVSAALGQTRIQPLAVGRAHRFATPAQRTALALRDGGCVMCGRPPAECQTHHLTDWAAGGRTDLDQMVLLCWTHHRHIDLNRFTITANPDTGPDQPHWLITTTPRHQWKRRSP